MSKFNVYPHAIQEAKKQPHYYELFETLDHYHIRLKYYDETTNTHSRLNYKEFPKKDKDGNNTKDYVMSYLKQLNRIENIWPK